MICTDNKIGKTQEKLFTFILIIPGATTFITFYQVTSSMYITLFVITQDASVNLHLFTKLLLMNLGCTKPPFGINLTGPFTPTALPTQRTVIEKLESL